MASKTGQCLCGAVRFALSDAPRRYSACHCGTCRRWSGGIELGFEVRPGGVRFEGADAIVTFTSSDWAERAFCGACGTHLYWKLTAPGPMQGLMSVSAGALDDMSGMDFAAEVYIDAKPASHAFAGERRRMTEAEVMAEVARMEAGAAHGLPGGGA